jgi:hypothetical protein
VQTLVRQSLNSGKSILGIGFGAHLLGLYASTKGLPFNWKYSVIDQIQNWKYYPAENLDLKYKRIIIDQDSGVYYSIEENSK